MVSELDPGKIKISDYSNAITDFKFKPESTEGAGDQKETVWTNSEWTNYYGAFLDDSDLQSAIILRAIWNVGQGWTADTRTTLILENMKGWGKDTFDDILNNMEIVAMIGGMSYAEIITHDGKILHKGGKLINLKPLDPGSMRHIVNRAGMLIRFEQWNKINNIDTLMGKFKPEEIFYINENRVADTIAGLQSMRAIKNILDAREESFKDMKTLMQRQVKPLSLWRLKLDDDAKIKKIIQKIEQAKKLGEDIFIPDDEDIISHESIFIPANALQSPFQWQDMLRNNFYRTIRLPQVLAGASGQSTESESKVIYLGHEAIIRARQLYLERQIWNQLLLKIKFNQAASLEGGLRKDEEKDAEQGLEFQEGDVTAGVAR